MTVRQLIFNFCTFLLFLNGCQLKTTAPGVEEAMSQAGNNRQELFKVVQHYQGEEDSLKLKAALFLIENMTDKFYLTGKSVDEYYMFMDSIYQIRQEEYDIPAIYEDFVKQARFLKEKPTIQKDIQTLSADYLIRNIESAFEVWNQAWNAHLSFDDFCELILPYRVGNETPEEWRSVYYSHFMPLLQRDTLYTAKEACTAINNELIKLPIHIANTSVLPIDLRSSTLLQMKFGLCNDYASLAVYAMRSVGIPVAKETVLHWGRGKGGHVFNVVYDNDGTNHDFSGAEENPDEHFIRFKHEIPKVYRETFGRQKESLAMICGNEEIPPIFKNAYLTDVTGNYPFINAKDVSVALPENKNDKKFAYLCVFDVDGWFPVGWGSVENDRVLFKQVGPNIVYQVAYYEKGKLQPEGYPFLLDTLGQMTAYEPEATTVDLVLERKKAQAANLAYLPPLMIGCQFQGADNKEFKNPVTLYSITEEPDFKYTTVEVSRAAVPVKYVRYQSSDQTWGNMAEVEFYKDDSEIPLMGKVIGKYEPSVYYPRNGAEKLFDGDALTFFHSNDTLSWGGLELEQPAVISKIRYIIRNDDNGIRKGHAYELFYADLGKWRSLGKKVAEIDDRIVFSQVPQGALYWLRDYTKGVEERIFEVKQDKTVIWH